ncbi:MAG: Fic family protein [Deltaproteobacteria bacterium]|nr:Fic family protein [Deltaproteobacteria bacterium]
MYSPHFDLSSRLLNFITQATELKTLINQSLIKVPWLPQLQNETTIKLAHFSTAIEGNLLTLPEVQSLSQGEEIFAEKKSKQEVLNYLSALRWIWTQKSNALIQETTLLKLHKIIAQSLLKPEQCGKYKTVQNRVVNSRGQTIYTPPAPQETQALVTQFLSWLNSKAAYELHPILSSAIAHHHLVSIHPFSDGNGRISRALGIWVLYTRGFDTHHLLALDEYFEADRARYYNKIQQARDMDNDLSYWIEYVAEGVVQTLKATQHRIVSLQVSAKDHTITLNKKQEDLLRFIRDKGKVRSPEIERAFAISRSRISQILQPLIAQDLVIREGFTRATFYRLA